MGKRVYVGLSGGVDSAVSAYLLSKAGYEVVGVFIKVWEPPFLRCPATEDAAEALGVAAHLGIPFQIIDLSERYRKEVIEEMVSEYEHGRTPNPDATCNVHIKFGAFRDWAFTAGADYIATGHYARINDTSGVELRTGLDPLKDQSYFLARVPEERLRRALFPIGGMQKSEVRKIAEMIGLPNAKRKDSQGLCFLGKIDIRDFLGHFISPRAGEIVTSNGEVVGKHEGLPFYTIGQRHRLEIAPQSAAQSPYYVVSKNSELNQLIVATTPKEVDGATELSIESCNWIGERPHTGKRYGARLRYRQPLFLAEVREITGASARISLLEPQLVPDGQVFVLYDGERCLGGGVLG